ncbi:MAG: AsmA family protein, partial [Hyphomicrobiaceae bacterium]|nr:AsmA family protein [Hyphomicrobiaceae bacterium]
TEPVFDLRVDANGRRNWDFAAPGKAASARGVTVAQAGPAKTGLPEAVKDFIDNASNPDNPSPSASAKLAALDDLTLGDVRIERGTIHYADARSGVDEVVTAIDADLSLTALQNPLESTGTLTWNGQPVGFDLKLASPRALLEDRPARAKLAIKAAPVDARFEGSLTARSGVELDGDLSAKGPSLRGLAKWFGSELPPADGFGAHTLEAKLKASPRSVALSDANGTLDGATVTGTIAADLSAIRPKISGNLKLSYLDLNRYTLAAAQPTPKPPTAKPKALSPAGGVTKPKSIEDLIDTVTGSGGPKVKGYSARDGWSSEPLQLDGLGAADADLRLSTGGLRWRDIKTGGATVTVNLKSKVLKVNLDEVDFYDGKGRGVVTIDATQPVPVVGANLSADGVSGAPLMKDAAGFDRISGKARLQIAVGGRGASELEIVETLAGKAEFVFANGAIRGVNVGGALKALQQSRIPNFKDNPSEATEFSELAATFAIDRGIATNSDLRMFSPLLRVGGGGQIALPQRTIDYVVRPRLVASAQGQGAADKASGEKLAGLEIPLKIRGSLADPAIEPDLGAILKDPNKAIEAAKELAKPFKGAGGLLKSLIGKGEPAPAAQGDPAAQPAAPQKIDPKKLLDGVLGR